MWISAVKINIKSLKAKRMAGRFFESSTSLRDISRNEPRIHTRIVSLLCQLTSLWSSGARFAQWLGVDIDVYSISAQMIFFATYTFSAFIVDVFLKWGLNQVCYKQWRSQPIILGGPKFFWGDKMVDFRPITLFCLGYRLL